MPRRILVFFGFQLTQKAQLSGVPFFKKKCENWQDLKSTYWVFPRFFLKSTYWGFCALFLKKHLLGFLRDFS